MTIPAVARVALREPGAVESVTLHVRAAAAAGEGPVVVLAHGAGSRVDHPVHAGISAAIAAAGLDVVGFNFAYAEAGRRSPDRTPKLQSCYRDVLDDVRRTFPGRPIVAGGRSMGGRVASLLAAQGEDVAGLALLNYPLVAARGGDAPPRTGHWPDIRVPVLFVHGNRDRLFPAALFAGQRAMLPGPTTVHVVHDADHSFAVPRRARRTAEEVFAEVARAVADWCAVAAVRA